MNTNKTYFDFVERLDSDPNFCFGATIQNETFYCDEILKSLFRDLVGQDIRTYAQELPKRAFKVEYNEPTWQKCAETISKDPNWSVLFCYLHQLNPNVEATKNLLDQLENTISKDAKSSFYYAANVLRNEFPLGEKVISQDAKWACEYAKCVIKNHRFPKGEKAISKNAQQSLCYALLLKERFPLGEQAISQHADYSLAYARDILKDRFELGEPSMVHSECAMLEYAKKVIKGKLPELLHNAMVLKSYERKEEAA
jgi:hypothetical protein